MDQPPVVCVAQRVRHFPCDPQCFLEGQPALARQPIAQRLPLDVGHHVVEHAGRSPGVVHGEDVGVTERGRDLDLAREALEPDRRSELGSQHLDGDLAVVLEVLGEMDRGHAPLAQGAHQAVAVG